MEHMIQVDLMVDLGEEVDQQIILQDLVEMVHQDKVKMVEEVQLMLPLEQEAEEEVLLL